jgi:selenide,water dikinase
MRKYDVSSCTDVTGFGLMGHALECINELVSFSISCNNVPMVYEAIDLANDDVIPGGTKRNMKYVEDKITYMNNLSIHCKALLCDAQTSGGLLIAMKEEDAKEYIKEIEELSFGYANIIGHVIPRGITPIIIH